MITQSDIDTAAEIVERQRVADEELPYPGPAPEKQRYTGWHNTTAVDAEVWGHVALGEERFATRAAMRTRLRQVQRAKADG